MVFARTARAKKTLMDNWQNAVKRRIYLAVVEGSTPRPSGEIVSYLRENAAGVMYVTADQAKGLRAVTRYRTLAADKGESLLSLELETGRRNQIRVQLAHLGCPVAGDNKYGSADARRPGRGESERGDRRHAIGRGSSFGRLALHAYSISFIHPKSGKEMTFTVPAPREFFSAVGLSELPYEVIAGDPGRH
jgi:23S rRNA-/tRNA-specific pseudouridylate synthase